MKKLLIVLLLFHNHSVAQENMFEKVKADFPASKNAQEKIDRYKSKKEIKKWERVTLKQNLNVSQNFKGILNIFDKNYEFEITDDYGIDINHVHGLYGKLKNGGEVILAITDEGLNASIWSEENYFIVEAIENNLYLVSEVDLESIYKNDGKNDFVSINEVKLKKTANGNSITSTLSPATVRVFVAYTADVAQNYNVSALISNSITTTNTSFGLSGISSTVELAGSAQVNYTESGDGATDVNRFMTNNDGYMDEIHNLRNQNQADICVLLVNSLADGTNGQSASVAANFTDAFCVVKASAAIGNYTFPHELGHLFGARHQKELDNNNIPHTYVHGKAYSYNGNDLDPLSFRTIMAVNGTNKNYGCSINKRIGYFSNPNINDPTSGVSTGDEMYASVVTQIDNYASTIAAFEPYYTTNGTIGVNEWWSGSITVTGNVIVASNTTLTLAPGTQITFSSGSSLTINGTLTANGTSTQPITFNFVSPNSSTQNGIKFNSGSSGTINYCQVRNAYRGVYENNVSVNITNTAISGCTDGVYLYVSNPTIQGCKIYNNTNSGITALYSGTSTVIKENYIQNNPVGLYCSTNSTPTIGNYSSQVGNNISSNNYGVIVFNNANPVMGNSSSGGYNNITGSYANSVLNTTGNTVYAQNNWWGTTDPNNFMLGGGSVSYSPYRSSAVSVPTPPLSKTSSPLVVSDDGKIPMLAELEKAQQFFASKNLTEARTMCLNLINNYPDYSVSYNALNLLKDTYMENDKTNTKEVYKSIFNKKEKKDLYAMAGLILSEIDKENKLNQIEEVIKKYDGESVVELALFDKFVYYYFDKNDVKSARQVSGELDKQFPKSNGAVEAHKILGDEEYHGIAPLAKQVTQSVSNQLPDKLELLENYPNPFNPNTTITFSLPQKSNVKLVVYDVLGKEVATLANSNYEAGKYSFTFNGSSLASGMYFYTLTTSQGMITKKMMLVK